MNNLFKYGFFALIAVIIVIVMFQGESDESKLYIDTLHAKIEALETDISDLEAQNAHLQHNIVVLNDSLSILDSDLAEIENKRISAIKYYEKRIKSLNNATTNELSVFFTERYGLSSDSTQEDSR